MTKEQARKELEGTWRFKLVGDKVALRELELIEAVSRCEGERAEQERLSLRQGKATYY